MLKQASGVYGAAPAQDGPKDLGFRGAKATWSAPSPLGDAHSLLTSVHHGDEEEEKEEKEKKLS